MKTKTIYKCTVCAATTPRWAGQCANCGEWNTLVEEVIGKENGRGRISQSGSRMKLKTLSEVQVGSEVRLQTSIRELDRVLGGGITRGSITLVGGDPGIGKSTLMLQMCANLPGKPALYITGEESLQQIKMRAGRLKSQPENMYLLAETNLDDIIATIRSEEHDFGVVIIDSIQTIYRPDIESAPGSVAQVRECTALLMQTAKKTGKPIFLVGHVTKDGMIAGPKVLEHMVDTVLQFEGESVYTYRILRAVKNRYGSTNEIGVFEMAEEGLREVSNPSEVFLSQRNTGESGTAVVATMEGSRPLLVEVQALVTPTSYGVPQRSGTGLDYRRLQMILAVLEKRLGLRLGQYDVFVNIAGGLKLDDPGVDLGIAAAIVSSYRDKPVPPELIVMGEIGLTGEVRTVSFAEVRLREAQKLGFATAIVPQSNMKRIASLGTMEVKPVDRIVRAFIELFPDNE
jgi:DNA repair protein RadA/Sms